MKRITTLLSAVLIIAVFVTSVFASPFLSSNPNADHTKYQLRLKAAASQAWGQWSEAQPVEAHLWYDLGAVPPGDYNGEVQGYGSWTATDQTSGQESTVQQWSPSAPFLLHVSPGIRVKIEK